MENRSREVYRLTLQGSEDILGLVSLIEYEDERVEIKLLAVSKENRGRRKIYEGISGNLIAWACRLAVEKFGDNACVSLIPKTRLKLHYMKKYGMQEAGKSLFLSDDSLTEILNRYLL